MGAGGLINIAAGGGLQNGGWQSITWTNNKASLNVNGSLDLWDGNSVTVDALLGSGSIAAGNGSTQTFNIGVNGGSGTYSGVINNGAGTTVLVSSAGSKEVLAGTNAYTGGTTISGGTLQFGGNAATPASQTLSGLVRTGQLVWAGSGVMVLTDVANSLPATSPSTAAP